MRSKPILICSLTIFLFAQCISDNVEEKYGSTVPVEAPSGEIAWFPLNGNLNDSTGNSTMIAVSGSVNFTDGVTGTGLKLNGSDNFIMISPGYLDTISILFWVKASSGIDSPNRPVLFDYGHGAITAALTDGVSGATNLTLKQDSIQFSSADMGEEYFLNSYCTYNLIYIEVTKNIASFYYSGTLDDGTKKVVSNQYEFPALFNASTELVYIGRSSVKDEIVNSFFKGNIDEIHIYDRFLTDSELAYFKNIQK
jgi:hypothetical protein